MDEPKTMFDFIRTRGTAFVSLVSNELMGNPAFLKAMQTAYRGGERLNGAVEQALKTMNVPSRSEFKRLVARIDALERELAAAREAQAAAAPAAGKRAARKTAPRRRKTTPAGA
jgi:Flp pilus assembly protein TadB